MKTILDIQHIDKRFAKVNALDNVSVQINEGMTYGLLGANGAGKTTLLRIINGILLPDAGNIVFPGIGTKQISSFVGYLPEERGLYPDMRVEEQLLFFAKLRGLNTKTAKEEIWKYLKIFELYNLSDKKTATLSKGTQQKIQFIATVLHRPELLILDEPFSGLDPVSMQIMKDEIVQLNKKGMTLIISTHDLNSVEEMCNDITLLKEGRVVLQDKLETIKQSYKKNIFKVITDTALTSLRFDGFQIISDRTDSRGIETLIRKEREISGNHLLQQILPIAQIISFEEILPDMREIFLEIASQPSHE